MKVVLNQLSLLQRKLANVPLKWKQRKDGAVMIPGYDTNTDPVGMVVVLEGVGITKVVTVVGVKTLIKVRLDQKEFYVPVESLSNYPDKDDALIKMFPDDHTK